MMMTSFVVCLLFVSISSINLSARTPGHVCWTYFHLSNILVWSSTISFSLYLHYNMDKKWMKYDWVVSIDWISSCIFYVHFLFVGSLLMMVDVVVFLGMLCFVLVFFGGMGSSVFVYLHVNITPVINLENVDICQIALYTKYPCNWSGMLEKYKVIRLVFVDFWQKTSEVWSVKCEVWSAKTRSSSC